MKMYSVKEYAVLTGKTRAAVYKKLETTLKQYAMKKDGRTVLLFPDGIDPVNPVNPVTVDNEVDNSTFSTTVTPIFNRNSTVKVDNELTREVDRLTQEVDKLTGMLQAKEAHLKDMKEQVDRLAAELDQERQAGKELRQLLNQQQALTAKHLAEPKKRPLLAAIFPKLYRQEEPKTE